MFLSNPTLQTNYTSPYMTANIIFSQDIIYSPLNNTVKQIDLINNQCQLLPFQTHHQIKTIAINGEGTLLVVVDMADHAVVFNLKGFFVVAQYHFKEKIYQAVFSPDGKLFAIALELGFCVYESPPLYRSFEPFILLKRYKTRHSSAITSISFSPDSRFLLTAGQDHIIYINNLFPINDYLAITLEVHRYAIISLYYSHDMKYIFSIDSGSNIFIWKWVDDFKSEGYQNMMGYKKRMVENRKGKKVKEEHKVNEEENQNVQHYSQMQKKITKGRYILSKKHTITQPGAYLKRTFYVPDTGFLVTAYSNGKFAIYKLIEQQLSEIQTFSVGENKISTITVNKSCTWLALGIKSFGQLIVWEWKSQSYILNQKGLIHQSRALAFNGAKYLATGTSDGSVKIFDQKTTFNVCTFKEHEASVTDLKFSNKNTLFSSSTDGSVNGYDLVKFKKFRKLKADRSCQFQCLECDQSGEVVFAGSFDPYEIYAWNVQTGNLLQIVGGHEGPITCLAMAGEQLMSGSWDRQLKIHQIFSRKTNVQTLDHSSQITAIAINPNKTQIAVSTMKSEIYIWHLESASLVGILQTQMTGGRSYFSKISADNDKNTKHIKTLAYSHCGNFLFGGGKSKYLMVYDVKQRGVASKIQITKNKDIQGVVDHLNSRFIKNGTQTYQMMLQEQQIDDEWGYQASTIPGAKKLDISEVRMKLEVEIMKIIVKNATQVLVCTSFGVLLFSSSSNNRFVFNPYELSPNLTPKLIPQLLSKKDFASALIVCLKLDMSLIKLIHKIPIEFAKSTISQIDHNHLPAILDKICQKSLDFRSAIWVQHILKQKITKIPGNVRSALEDMQQQVKIMQKTQGVLQMATSICGFE